MWGSTTSGSTATRCSGRAQRSVRCWCWPARVITVLTVALINLISELTGGIRLIVIEEEPWPQKQEQVAAGEAQPLPSDPAAGL